MTNPQLTDDAEGLIESVQYKALLEQRLSDDFPQLKDKVRIIVKGA